MVLSHRCSSCWRCRRRSYRTSATTISSHRRYCERRSGHDTIAIRCQRDRILDVQQPSTVQTTSTQSRIHTVRQERKERVGGRASIWRGLLRECIHVKLQAWHAYIDKVSEVG